MSCPFMNTSPLADSTVPNEAQPCEKIPRDDGISKEASPRLIFELEAENEMLLKANATLESKVGQLEKDKEELEIALRDAKRRLMQTTNALTKLDNAKKKTAGALELTEERNNISPSDAPPDVRDALNLLRSEVMDALFDAAFDPMFQINEKGVIQTVNRAATQVFGWSGEEFLGSNISKICGGDHASHHDEYLARYLKTGEQRVIGKRREVPAVRKDGSTFSAELGIKEVKTSSGERLFCGFVRDLTKQKEAQEEIEHKSQLMNAMINASFEAMLEIDMYGNIENVNTAACKIFGWTREDFIGKNFSMIIPDEHAENHALYLSSYLATGHKRVIGKQRKMEAKKKDGSKFPILLGVQEVKHPSGRSCFCGFIKDISHEEIENQRLTRKEQLTAGMINASFDAIFQINSRGIIHMVNQAGLDQFQYSREELLGNNISIICGGNHGEKHNGYMERYLRTGEKRVMGKRRELMAKRKDGTEFPIELGLQEVDTIWGEKFFCGFVRDIRRQRFDLGDLNEKEKLTWGLLQVSYDPLLGVDDQMRIFIANRAAKAYFALSEDKHLLSDKHLWDLMPDNEARKDQMKAIGDHILNREKRPLEMYVDLVTKGGKAIGAYMRFKEVDGPFPVLFGIDDTPDKRRVFAVVLDLAHGLARSNNSAVPNISIPGFLQRLEHEEAYKFG